MENQSKNSPQLESNDAEDIKKLLIKYLRYWPAFILSAVIFVSGAFIYLRYTPNVYQTSAKIKVLKDQGGIDMSGFQGSSPLIDLSKVNLDNEAEILKSRRLAENVIQNLSLQTQFYSQGTIKTFLLWGNEIPFQVAWNLDQKRSTPQFELTLINQNEFKLFETESEFKGTFQFGDLIEFEDYSFSILTKGEASLTENLDENKVYKFSHAGLDNAVTRLTSKVNVENVGDRSEILRVSMNGENKVQNEAIINNLIYQFNKDGVDDNKKIAEQTEKFASERLEFLFEELDTVETDLVDFKKESSLVTVESSVTELFSKNATAEGEAFKIATQLLLVEALQQRIEQMDNYALLPPNIGLSDGEVNSFIEKYNEIVLKRQELLVSSTENSLVIQEINQQLKRLKQNIVRTVDAYQSGLEISKRRLDQKERSTQSNISSLPEKEKRLREITRQQLVKERLYVFLLQKREEAALTSAVMSDIAKVVDYAYTAPVPVSPKSRIVLLGSFLLSLILPFGFLYIKFLLNTKINDKEEIKSYLPNLPIAGEIPLLNKNEDTLIRKNSSDALAESFRILRTNLNFMGLNKNGAKIIFVTSTMKGEGKTFASINLAATISTTRSKCLLIGADLRNPQIHNFLKIKKDRAGLSKFLYDETTAIDELIINNPLPDFNLDVVLSGEIPPNPSELLVGNRFEEFLNEVKKDYEYIIVDTAPTILVTDTLLISKYADITLYTIRANYTDIQLLDHIREISSSKKLNNIGIVFNGVENTGAYAYNYGYGYGYQTSTKAKRNRLKFW